MKTLRLILGDQLNYNHSWFKNKDENTLYVLMEIKPEQEYVKHHIQKIVGFFAAMRAFGQHLKEVGHHVQYFKYNDAENKHSFKDNIKWLIEKDGIGRFEYMEPDEYRLDELLKGICSELLVETAMVGSQHFITQRNDVADFFKGKKTYLMESFYRKMRKELNIMMEGKDPIGGQWNFDHDNRKKYKGEVPIPKAYLAENDVTDIYQMVLAEEIPHFGEIDPKSFAWPINKEQAEKQMLYFGTYLLQHFGEYEDAMYSQHSALFHSRLSFALNVKLISPIQLVSFILNVWDAGNREIPINNIEGFIRQVIGWREFMRGVYWAKMPEYENLNFFENNGKLPSWFWTGETKMNCLKQSIKGSLKNAWAHHIQRLMITGNFAALIGAHPDKVDAWYLGIYIDAIQWVELTNTRGMSQFADGGLLATKPYVSSASYINKMSDYCSGCKYNHKLKTEENACPFNSLYWDYYERNREKLQKNPRIGMMYRVWDKMKNQEEILEKADRLKANLNNL